MNMPVINDPRSYTISEWNSYAKLFASVTTSIQINVYKEASSYLTGNVVDCGSGTAKLAPFLAKKADVMSYTGIDFSEEMVESAQWLLQKLERPSFTVRKCKIEDAPESAYSSGVSIQSYYSWPNPVKTLDHIFKILAPNAIFVLATPNKKLNLDLLVDELMPELLTHPFCEPYRDYNLRLVTNPQANFVSMDSLVEQVRKVGFLVESCHQQHFEGGLNFVVLKKEIAAL